MGTLFIKLLNMSISACWLVLAIILFRLLLKDAPKFIRCILWALVGIRLVCPLSIKSIFSLIPSAEIVPESIIQPQSSSVNEEMILPGQVSEGISHIILPNDSTGANLLQAVITIASIVWFVGLVVMLAYGIVSWIRLKKRTAASINLRDNIWICDDIDSPFILGLVRPRIFVPSDVGEQQLCCIEAHEKAHLARRDHWWKPLGYAVLALHWFNPVIWLAYVLLCRDIELACDERVIKSMDMEHKRDYSRALLSCSVTHRSVAACPLAFGEVGVKERVSSVLNYKKPAFWLIIAAVAVCLAVGVCFMTNPAVDSEIKAYLHTVILEEGRSDRTEGHFACEAHDIIGAKRDGDKVIIYALVMYSEFSFENGVIVKESGWHIPSVITIDTGGSAYSYDYWISSDGTRYVPSIREKFPWYLENMAINISRTADRHRAECIRQAEEYYGTEYIDPYADTVRSTQAQTAPYTADSTLMSVTGSWKNVSKNDLGTTMTFSEDKTGLTLFRGYEMPFTWSMDGYSIDVFYAPGAHVYFELTEQGGEKRLISGDDYYVMIPEEMYDGYVNIVDIDLSNWQEYFEICQSAYVSEKDGMQTGLLTNVFRLKEEYAAGFVDADIYIKYAQSNAAVYSVVYDLATGESQLTKLSADEITGKGYVLPGDSLPSATRFMDYHAESLWGLELAGAGDSLTGSLAVRCIYDDVVQWESAAYDNVEITEISGKLIFCLQNDLRLA